MRARYLGPLIVISRNCGGAYIIAELDGSVFDRPVAAFQVIPYFACMSLDTPSVDELMDISWSRLAANDPEEDDFDDAIEDDDVGDDWGQSRCKLGGGGDDWTPFSGSYFRFVLFYNLIFHAMQF